MKLLSISAMSASVAMANDLAAMWNGALNKDSSQQALRLAGGDDRNVMDLFTLSNIFQYGCWCHFGDSKPARGPTMDKVDGFCKRWVDSKDCIRIDNENAGTTCDTSIQYNDILASSGVGSGPGYLGDGTLAFPFDPDHDYSVICDANNQAADFADADEAACAADNCKIDAYFLRDIFTHMSFNNLNNSLSVSFGFDTDFTCRGIVANSLMPSTVAPFTTAAPVVPTTAAGATTAAPIPAWQCCGSFPDRFPYKTNNGGRSCCVSTTYATALLECCPNGSTAVIGAC